MHTHTSKMGMCSPIKMLQVAMTSASLLLLLLAAGPSS
jgi:hypothetical protein